MKKLKKIIIGLLCITMIATNFIGCKSKDDANILYLHYTQAGFGGEVIDKLTEEFTKDTNIPVKVVKTTDKTTAQTMMFGGPKSNYYDLIFGIVNPFADIVRKDAIYNDKNIYMDLEKLYQKKVFGSEKKLIEVVNKDIYEIGLMYDIEGKSTAYTVPWGQALEGLIYNETVLENYGIFNLPRTTNEFIEMLESIKLNKRFDDNKSVPKDKQAAGVIYPGVYSYWPFVWPAWWAQYDGMESMKEFYRGLKAGDNINALPSYEANDRDGKKKAIETLGEIILNDNGYTHGQCYTLTHTDAQLKFLLNEAAFIPSADWLESESAKNAPNARYKIMRTPIISSLGEKLGISEEELRECISYIDYKEFNNGSSVDKPDVDDEILKKLAESRKIACSGTSQYYKMFIPSYSNAIDKAEQFVLWFASEKAQKIYTQYAKALSVYNYETDTTNVSNFKKSVFDILGTSTKLFDNYNFPIRYLGNLRITAHTVMSGGDYSKGFERFLANGEKSADKICKDDRAYYQKNWQKILKDSGYTN